MSAPSGIKVPVDIASSFSSAQSSGDAVRALVWVIEGESFKLHDTIKSQSTFKDDIELLPKSLPTPKTPASFAYRLDSKEGGRYEWMMITYVPDDAGVRAKMLQASSRGGLMKALGAGNFKHDWFATSLKDLTPSALNSHLNHLSSPAPLSAAEKALAEVREAEAEEAKRAMLDPRTEERRKAAVVGLSGQMKLQEGVKEALQKVAQRSDDGWAVVLDIKSLADPTALSLVLSEACTPSQLASKVPSKTPSYTFYSFPTPPAPASAASPAKTWKSASAGQVSGNSFHASEGGKRFVTTTWTKASDGEEPSNEKKEEAKNGEEGGVDVNKLAISTEDVEVPKEDEVEHEKEVAASPEEEKPATSPATSAPAKDEKGRVIFIYSCPSASPVKFRMIYSTSTRGVQQDAINLGVEIVGKQETSDPSELTETQLRSSLPSSSFTPSTQAGLPKHASSLPTPSSANISSSPSFGAPKPAFGAPAPAFGGAFGRPRPVVKKVESYSSATSASQIPLPASAGPGTPISPSASASTAKEGEEDDSKERIKSAFDAFGPRVGAGGGGGFARPRPAGRR